MFNIIPLIVILIALAVVAVIIVRKFPQLANLDTASLPQEKEASKKKEILAKRIEERGRRLKELLLKRLGPVRKLWGLLQLRFRIYVGKMERLWHHEQAVKTKAVAAKAPEEARQKVTILVQEGENLLGQGQAEQAEEKFIAAIKLDQKSASAYRGLGFAYAAKGSLEEARETFRFVLQLEPDDDSVMVKLADMAESQGDLEEAIQYYQQAVLINDALSPRFYHLAELLNKVGQPEVAKEAIVQAVELEPKNPKYLDLMTETAIICGDRSLSERGMNELRLVNPENQKLNDFRERILKM